MAKQAIQIEVNEFQTVVSKLEGNGKTFENRSQLWRAVSETEWAKNCKPRPLTPQVAMIKAQEFQLKIITPKGKKGLAKGAAPIKRKRQMSKESQVALTKAFPERPKLVAQVIDGSLKAAIKLHCLDCAGMEKSEVAKCCITSCPFWHLRAYKHKDSLTPSGRKKICLEAVEKQDSELVPC